MPVNQAPTSPYTALDAPEGRDAQDAVASRSEAHMSGTPSPDGARKALALIDRLAAAEDLINQHRPSVAILRQAEEEYRQATEDLDQTLRSMDVESTGNYGYSKRTAWLLAEVVRLARSTL